MRGLVRIRRRLISRPHNGGQSLESTGASGPRARPGKALRSTSTTSQPASDASMAAVIPLIPPPTTITVPPLSASLITNTRPRRRSSPSN